MNVLQKNKKAWDKLVTNKNRWTVPVPHEEIESARKGNWQVLLTPCKPVPKGWFPEIKGCNLLCLASGGGQQTPIFAAAGAKVTSFDNSPKMLEQDQLVAHRELLKIKTIEGDMADLSIFKDGSFDIIFNPVSNCFIPQVQPVWNEAYRILKKGGALVAGFTNPVEYCFDIDLAKKGIYHVKYSLPYSDLESISEEERIHLIGADDPVEFSHTMEEQIGGQLKAGFVITNFFEDFREEGIIKDFMPSFFATKAVKF
jgi:SAM-dependent methyltransferase